MPDPDLLYPRAHDKETIYLKNAITDSSIEVGDFTMYNDFFQDPRNFEKNNVLYHYPVNHEKLVIGKFCSIACNARFLFNAANHALSGWSTYPFSIFFDEWNLKPEDVASSWENKGDIIIGNDVWIGYEAIILAGVHIADGAVIGARAIVTKDVAPYTIVAGAPARVIRKRYDEATISRLLELQWWNWPAEKIQRNLPALQSGSLDELLNAEKEK